jgi:Xaa-Pro aminopeptidase
MTHLLNQASLVSQRKSRLLEVMRLNNVPVILTADPISILYATGARNMTIHGFTGPDRFMLLFQDGYTVLYEFAGCEHLAADLPEINEIRPAPGITAKKTLLYADQVQAFANELFAVCSKRMADSQHRIAVEKLEFPMTDSLRSKGFHLIDAGPTIQLSMSIKQPDELQAIREAMRVVEKATAELESTIAPGVTENEVWAAFHRGLIASGGEYVVTRLLQAGERTFPYFLESSDHQLQSGDLVCFDTDAMSLHSYSIDFSRTFLCGNDSPTPQQKNIYRLALEQLEHNASHLAPGRSFEEFASNAFEVPERYRNFGYYQLAHGLGLAGGYPNVPRIGDMPYGLPGEMLPGMVLCIESYIGDPETRQGVKLEDQYFIHADHVERLSRFPLDSRLSHTLLRN